MNSEVSYSQESENADDAAGRSMQGVDQCSVPAADSTAPADEGNRLSTLSETEEPIVHKDSIFGKYIYQDRSLPAPNDINNGPKSTKRQSIRPTTLFSAIAAHPLADILVSMDPDSNSIHYRVDTPLVAYHANRVPTSYADTLRTPKTLSEAIHLPEAKDWKKATDLEYNQLLNFGTWTLVPLPPSRKAIKSKWVFRIKRNSKDEVEKFKSRLVACGYSQKEGVDYTETFSPVAQAISIRLFLSIVASRNMEFIEMDTPGAFLRSDIDNEDLYLKQAEGYVDPEHPDWVYKLMKSLYGLKQASKAWFDTINPFLLSLGFQPLDSDPCIYHKYTNGRLAPDRTRQ